MKKLLTILAILVGNAVYAQNIFKAIINDDKTKLPLTGATAIITSLKREATADTAGKIIIKDIPNGKIEVTFNFVGYLSQDKTLNFPLKDTTTVLEIYLEPLAGELAEVAIQTIRTN